MSLDCAGEIIIIIIIIMMKIKLCDNNNATSPPPVPLDGAGDIRIMKILRDPSRAGLRHLYHLGGLLHHHHYHHLHHHGGPLHHIYHHHHQHGGPLPRETLVWGMPVGHGRLRANCCRRSLSHLSKIVFTSAPSSFYLRQLVVTVFFVVVESDTGIVVSIWFKVLK